MTDKELTKTLSPARKRRRSGLSVQKGGSISGPLFLCLKNPNFVVFQFHQGERIPAHVLAYIQSSWL
ncbi:TPA: hypothetical protein ACV7XO_005222 [Escherichia coli]